MDTQEQGEQHKLRVAFIHPDLGIGGAERLVVDAALGLQNKGHTVSIHTSHHDPAHCFDETKDGTLQVVYHKPPIFLPRSLHGKFHILFAHLRQLHLTWQLVRSLQSLRTSKADNTAGLSPGIDVFFVDQLSTCLPILRFFTGRRVVFYCHFPDKLLASGEFIDEEDDSFPSAALDAPPAASTSRTPKQTSLLKKLYRLPMDYLEERTTATADLILVNSLFTSRVFKRYFPTIKLDAKGMRRNSSRNQSQQLNGGPRVVYPGINLEAYEQPIEDSAFEDANTKALISDRPTFISLNRFEAKKNISLAVNAFALFLSNLPKPSSSSNLSKSRLVLGGGYDPRVQENVETLKSLLTLISSLNLTWALISSSTKASPELPEDITGQAAPSVAQVVLLPNFTTTQRSILLKSASTMALLYTPNNEHFGIVPVEAMACGLPVLACKSGGPKESIIDSDDEPTPSNSTTTESSAEKDMGGEWSVLELSPKPSTNTSTPAPAMPTSTRTGYLRAPDAAQWALVLHTISTLSPSSRTSISRASCSRAKKYFSMEAMARGLERALEDAYRLGPVNGKYGMSTVVGREAIMEVLVWGYVCAVIVSLWLFGGTCTMGWTAVLLIGSTAFGSLGFLKLR